MLQAHQVALLCEFEQSVHVVCVLEGGLAWPGYHGSEAVVWGVEIQGDCKRYITESCKAARIGPTSMGKNARFCAFDLLKWQGEHMA